ncbi:MAG TPA: LysM peptidoglycan-binding domain-containing protein [Candidatus Coprosoma intestinipullorum]|uniref:LysM peptidoglycan-binding domain-containing protein n=1 Tax=Candidatus Coprosoma intestinipullorum TaxID=2840752 RepID=A0A9D0ZRQ2_9FIRM|nr:LysM peptidoglycan-binding domain-containing protein [Candidatus Coprosoma intestinipullorum]
MEKIVPFKRDISFETKIAEIRSISLEHTYEIQNNLISGTFIISGNYKLTDTSTNVDPFKFEVPFDISIDSRYELNKATVDINDFFYELINNEVLSVSITLIIDNLEEKEEREMEEIQEEKQEVEEIKPVSYEEAEKDDETEEVKPVSASPETVKSIFDNMDENEGYVVYKVHIVTENDTVESIMEKYDVTKEALEAYNNLNDLKIGDKLIVPA